MREQRPSARKRGYSHRWEAYSSKYLLLHPLCIRCLRAHRQVASTVVDHIKPHKGDHKLFWDPKNHQALCSTCHSGDKQRYEKTGKAQYRGCDQSGTPLDPDHNWHKQPLTP